MLWKRRLVRGRRTNVGLALVIVAIAAGVVALGLAWRTDWGPLAVVRVDSGYEALNHGILRITDTCVFLEGSENARSVLVWREQRTRWNADTREIVLQNRDGGYVTLSDGEQVTFGGGSLYVAGGGVPSDKWIEGIDWVSKPDPDCPNDFRWFVNDVVAAR